MVVAAVEWHGPSLCLLPTIWGSPASSGMLWEKWGLGNKGHSEGLGAFQPKKKRASPGQWLRAEFCGHQCALWEGVWWVSGEGFALEACHPHRGLPWTSPSHPPCREGLFLLILQALCRPLRIFQVGEDSWGGKQK